MDKLLELLRNGVVSVQFTKVDGSLREMPCTLNENLIPANMLPKGSGKAQNTGTLAVFCVDKQEWRSFRRDSVISYTDALTGVELCSGANF